jgi:hypothetical protein
MGGYPEIVNSAKSVTINWHFHPGGLAPDWSVALVPWELFLGALRALISAIYSTPLFGVRTQLPGESADLRGAGLTFSGDFGRSWESRGGSYSCPLQEQNVKR